MECMIRKMAEIHYAVVYRSMGAGRGPGAKFCVDEECLKAIIEECISEDKLTVGDSEKLSEIYKDIKTVSQKANISQLDALKASIENEWDIF